MKIYKLTIAQFSGLNSDLISALDTYVDSEWKSESSGKSSKNQGSIKINDIIMFLEDGPCKAFGENVTLQDLGEIEQTAFSKWLVELSVVGNKMPRHLQNDPVQWAVSNGFLPDGYIRGQYRKSNTQD
jgi:hypothetical protein